MEHLDEIIERLQEIRKELDSKNEKNKQLNIIDEIKKQDEQYRQDTSKN